MVKKIMLLVIVVSVVVLSGCVGSPPKIINSSALINISLHPGAPRTIVIYEQDNNDGISTVAITFIVGKLTDIRLPNENDITYKNILVFEDGTVVLTDNNNGFEWKLNKIYAIVMRNNKITSINIYE